MNGASRRGAVVSPQLILGLLLLLIGGALLLDNLGLMNAYYIVRLWPVALILIGLSCLFQSERAAGRAACFFWIFIGTWLLLGNLHVFRLHLWDLWPLPFIVAGTYLMWQSLGGHRAVADGGSLDSSFSALALLGGVTRKINSRQFKGGEATALLGGCKIDLRDADIADEEAVIHAVAFWGGIELVVPEGWSVVNRIFPIMGAAEDQTRPSTTTTPKRLVIRGIAIMGGIEIKN
jgi:predicted membrane protein